MTADTKALATQLGNAVFERIAKEGLLNKELIVDALYRELLVVLAEGNKPAPASADPHEGKTVARIVAEACATAKDPSVGWTQLNPAFQKSWLSVARVIIGTPLGQDVQAEALHRAYYGSGVRPLANCPQTEKALWWAITRAGREALAEVRRIANNCVVSIPAGHYEVSCELAPAAQAALELREVVATALQKSYGELPYDNAERGWLHAADALIDLEISPTHPPSEWPQIIRRTFFDALMKSARPFKAIPLPTRHRWMCAVEAGRAAYRDRTAA